MKRATQLLVAVLLMCVTYSFAVVQSPGCGSAAPYPLSSPTLDFIVHDTLNRTFRVYLPATYDSGTAVPLVMMLHGGGGSSSQFYAGSNMHTVAEANNFVAVWPDGTGAIQTWNGGSCCGSAVTNNIDDVGFFSSMIDYLASRLCLDLTRVYSAGHSNGGIMSHRLACELPDKIAAIAPNSGVMSIPNSQCDADYAGKRKVSVIHMHGTGDLHVPWIGGPGCGFTQNINFTSVNVSIEGWRKRNGCSTSKTIYLEEGNGQCNEYSNCEGGSQVILCAVYEGGHAWFGGGPPNAVCTNEGTNNSAFSSDNTAWNFLKVHSLNDTGSSSSSSGTSSRASVLRSFISPIWMYVEFLGYLMGL